MRGLSLPPLTSSAVPPPPTPVPLTVAKGGPVMIILIMGDGLIEDDGPPAGVRRPSLAESGRETWWRQRQPFVRCGGGGWRSLPPSSTCRAPRLLHILCPGAHWQGSWATRAVPDRHRLAAGVSPLSLVSRSWRFSSTLVPRSRRFTPRRSRVAPFVSHTRCWGRWGWGEGPVLCNARLGR